MSVQFIEQIKAFEMLCDGLTAQAQILYYKLFKHNNYYGLGLPFYVTNEVLMHDSLIRNKQTFINARNALIQRGFITYKSGKKGSPSVYQLIDLSPILKGYKLYPKADQKRTESVPKADQKRTESVPKAGHNIAIANTIPRAEAIDDNSARAKFVPPTLDEVNEYIIEKKLHVKAKEFLDFFTEGKWVDTKGQPVRNWKQKLLTWEKYQPKDKSPKSSSDIADRAIAMAEQLDRGGGTW